MSRLTLKALLRTEDLPAAIAEIAVTQLVLDSRQLSAGDTFVAVPGGAVDGRQFIASAIKKQVALVLSHTDAAAITWQSKRCCDCRCASSASAGE